jgi:hypothetical protein
LVVIGNCRHPRSLGFALHVQVLNSRLVLARYGRHGLHVLSWRSQLFLLKSVVEVVIVLVLQYSVELFALVRLVNNVILVRNELLLIGGEVRPRDLLLVKGVLLVDGTRFVLRGVLYLQGLLPVRQRLPVLLQLHLLNLLLEILLLHFFKLVVV